MIILLKKMQSFVIILKTIRHCFVIVLESMRYCFVIQKETNAPRAQDKETSAEPVKESVFESKSASQEEDEVTAKESAAEAVQSEG